MNRIKTRLETSALLDRGGKPTVRELLGSLAFNPTDGTIRLNDDRLVMQRAAFGAELRRELVRLLGEAEARVFLIRLGYLAGRSDAQFVRSAWPNLDRGDAFTAGTRLHTFSGIVRVETLHNDFDLDRKRFSGDFLWHDSVEAVDRAQVPDPDAAPVCWTQTGYASGYASYFFDTLIVYKEVSCACQGHRSCRVVGKPAAGWGEDDPDVVLFRQRIAPADSAAPAPARAVAAPVPRDPTAGLSRFERLVLAPVLPRLAQLRAGALPVLISGPTGSGRMTAVRALRRIWGVEDIIWTRLPCAGLDPETLIRVLTPPARTPRRAGAQSLVVLEDLEQMPAETQARLSILLDDGDRLVNFLLFATTALAPADLARASGLRADLRYNFSVQTVELPRLADRPAEIGALAGMMLASLAVRFRMPTPDLDDSAVAALQAGAWPGDLRELEAVLSAAMIAAEPGAALTGAMIRAQRDRIAPAPRRDGATEGLEDWLDHALAAGGFRMEEMERRVYAHALARSDGNVAAAARLLGLSRAQLAYRLSQGAADSGG